MGFECLDILENLLHPFPHYGCGIERSTHIWRNGSGLNHFLAGTGSIESSGPVWRWESRHLRNRWERTARGMIWKAFPAFISLIVWFFFRNPLFANCASKSSVFLRVGDREVKVSAKKSWAERTVRSNKIFMGPWWIRTWESVCKTRHDKRIHHLRKHSPDAGRTRAVMRIPSLRGSDQCSWPRYLTGTEWKWGQTARCYYRKNLSWRLLLLKERVRKILLPKVFKLKCEVPVTGLVKINFIKN